MPSFFSKFTNIYTDKSINGWVRGVAWVGTAAVIYMAGHTAYKAIFKTQAEKDAAAALKAVDNSINDQRNAGVVQTYPDDNYTSFANTIYNSGGWILNDSYSVIVDTLSKMQNDLDVALLIKAFGTRPPHIYAGLSFGTSTDLFGFVNATLNYQFVGLTNPSKDTINKDWAKKGIKYQL
jgi:hypothetical protein